MNDLVRRLQALGPDLAAIEATGGFEQAAASAGLPLVAVNPAQVRHFAKALGQRAKSDPLILNRSKDRCGHADAGRSGTA